MEREVKTCELMMMNRHQLLVLSLRRKIFPVHFRMFSRCLPDPLVPGLWSRSLPFWNPDHRRCLCRTSRLGNPAPVCSVRLLHQKIHDHEKINPLSSSISQVDGWVDGNVGNSLDAMTGRDVLLCCVGGVGRGGEISTRREGYFSGNSGLH